MSGRRNAGFVVADALLGIAIAVALAGVLATSAVWTRRTADRAADGRAATAAAESALVDLAAGQPPPADVRVAPASAPAVPGYRWVRVTAVVHGRPASLVGLAKGDQ